MLIRSAPGTGPTLPELNHRLRWLVLVVVVAFGVLLVRLWQLQVVRGDEYLEQALSNVVHKQFISSVRGKILDRRGQPFATNRPAFNIYVTPKHYAAVRPELINLLGLDEDEQQLMDDRVEEARARGQRASVMVLGDQGSERAAVVEQAMFRLEGVDVLYEPYRDYPHGAVAAHVIGYMNKMSQRELEELGPLGYDDHELIGRDGIERKMENQLRGKKGEERFVVNARGQRVEGADAEGLIDGPPLIAPVAGKDVVLTLDLDLQLAAEKAAGEDTATGIVVVEVDTGRILAIVSKPSFDSNIMTGQLTRARKAELDADPREPFIDKTLQQHYPPGSLYKFVTAIAALDDGLVTEDEKLVCPGYYERSKQTFRCTSKHEAVNMREAVQHSCNVYFWKLAERIGLDRMAETSTDFGFGSPTGLGLNGDLPGTIPTKAWYRQHSEFKIGNTLNAATGQGDVEVTVMQLAMAYAALANGGKLYVPQIIREVRNASGETMFSYEPQYRKVKASPESLQILHDGMDLVVNAVGGTAHDYAYSEKVHFAGKTGTAQVRRKRRKQALETKGWHPSRDHAWFGGYAPAENPEIAIVVLVEHGGPGGKVAGPVARKIIEAYFEEVKPKAEAERAARAAKAAEQGATPAPQEPAP